MQEYYVAGLQRQDEKVFSELYDAYGGALHGAVVGIVRQHEIAEQVLQDTFVKIWRNGATYDVNKGRLYTWMLNIARNTAIDATRSADFQRRKSMDSTDQLEYRAGQTGITVDHIGVRDTLNQLDEKYRVLVDMIYFKGYTQEEVAEETGIPLGTIKTRLRAAMQELRRVFGSAFIASLTAYLLNRQ